MEASSSTEEKFYKLAVSHEEMNPRRRNTMEDCHRIVPELLHLGKHSYSYFGVYDGHGGRQIVDFLENALEQNIVTELSLPDEAEMFERMARAFLITDMQSRKLNITTSGATAVSVLLRSEVNEERSITSRKLFVGNVGDSRAILACAKLASPDSSSLSGYYAKRLTYDHRAEDLVEQQRIKDAGGFITRSRVLGILAVSRSFGDHGMKDFVIADPYLTETDLADHQHCPFLILACDGVWDVMTDQQAVDMLMEKYKEAGGPFADAAQHLVHTALEKGSTDNITAIVVFL